MNHIETMCREHFNEPILVDLTVGRLVGYGEDDVDCYLIVKFSRWAPQGGFQLLWQTAVGGYTFLNRLSGITEYNMDDFENLDRLLEIRGVPKEPEFICEIKKEATCQSSQSTD